MRNVERLSITLSPELLKAVKNAVATGEYASASEVVGEALREWMLRRSLRAEIESLRKAWDDGIRSGETTPFDIKKIKGRARNLAALR